MEELIVDNFCGGGGASCGIEAAIGRPVDIAVNHDIQAIRMHMVNHPGTKHYLSSVWDVDPVEACKGRPVGLLWLSPDCTHFSKARGTRPVKKHIRSLSWLAVKWASTVKPRQIYLENVEEILTWGPVIKKADGKFYPCPKRKGRTFKSFINALKRHGYKVSYRPLRACDYGAPTIRKRLFLIARCDGQPIVWPEPTHGDPKSEAVKSGKLLPWHTAAECIDFSIPVKSIFGRKKPLAETTLRRIAKGFQRYVVESPNPFVITYYGDKDGEFRGQSINEPLRTQTTENRHAIVVPHIVPLTHQGSDRTNDIKEPFPTVTAAHRGELALVAPTLVGLDHVGADGKHRGKAAEDEAKHALVASHLVRTDMHKSNAGCQYSLFEPVRTITSTGGHAVVEAFLAKYSIDTKKGKKARKAGKRDGYSADELPKTVLNSQEEGLITSHLVKLRGTCKDGQPVTEPMPTICAGGQHVAEVQAFMIKYYSTPQDPKLDEPMHTVTTKDRFGLVYIYGSYWRVVDIGLRMLKPRELFAAQGFPKTYIIDRDVQGKKITLTAQVNKVGNSVCPDMAEALVRANYVSQQTMKAAA